MERSGTNRSRRKKFSDVGDNETILKERWTAAKFVRNQLRVVLDNLYDPGAEPDWEIGLATSSVVTHEAFVKIVQPALGYLSNADKMAILKRGAFILFTKKNSIIYRIPGELPADVPRIRFPGSQIDLIKMESKPKIKHMKSPNSAPPALYENDCAWEMEWFKEAVRKHEVRVTDMAQKALAREKPAVAKIEPQDFQGRHVGLARDTARDNVEVEADDPAEPPHIKTEFGDRSSHWKARLFAKAHKRVCAELQGCVVDCEVGEVIEDSTARKNRKCLASLQLQNITPGWTLRCLRLQGRPRRLRIPHSSKQQA